MRLRLRPPLVLGWTAAILALAVLPACQKKEPISFGEEGEADEPSPNAQILPAPLSGAQSRGSLGRSGILADEADVVVPLSFDKALREEEPLGGPGVGVEFSVDWLLPEVRRTAELGAQGGRARAGLLVQILPKIRDGSVHRVARQRLLFLGALLHLPEGTELRSRSDRFGFIVVWPDGRSYRTVPRGALSALFEERRVDVMPPFEAVVPPAEELSLEPQKLVARRVRSPLGELTMTMSEQAEWGESTRLFCEVLVELMRVRSTDEACPAGELPVEIRYKWASGGELRGSVTGLRRRTDLDLGAFAMPPEMPIFKPGELPPDDEFPWSAQMTAELFPRGLGPALRFKNTLEVPVLLLLDGVPARRLDPEQEWQFSPGRPGVRYSARDFLGQTVRPGSPLTPPATVHLGAEPEVRPEGASSNPSNAPP